jgi:hypothetical protein
MWETELLVVLSAAMAWLWLCPASAGDTIPVGLPHDLILVMLGGQRGRSRALEGASRSASGRAGGGLRGDHAPNVAFHDLARPA